MINDVIHAALSQSPSQSSLSVLPCGTCAATTNPAMMPGTLSSVNRISVSVEKSPACHFKPTMIDPSVPASPVRTRPQTRSLASQRGRRKQPPPCPTTRTQPIGQ